MKGYDELLTEKKIKELKQIRKQAIEKEPGDARIIYRMDEKLAGGHSQDYYKGMLTGAATVLAKMQAMGMSREEIITSFGSSLCFAIVNLINDESA